MRFIRGLVGPCRLQLLPCKMHDSTAPDRQPPAPLNCYKVSWDTRMGLREWRWYDVCSLLQPGSADNHLMGDPADEVLCARKEKVSMMNRRVLALLTLLCLFSPASASLAPRKDSIDARRGWSHTVITNSTQELWKSSSGELVKESPGQRQPTEFRITDQTEVQLDGRPCKYEEVPNDAVIIHLEAASETNRVILKIHFRSKK